MSKAHVDAIEAAIKAALTAPKVEPIVMAELDEDGTVLYVTPYCPNCGADEIVEVEYGKVAINQTDAELLNEDTDREQLALTVSQWDRDRHTLAYACSNSRCWTFYDLEEWDVVWG